MTHDSATTIRPGWALDRPSPALATPETAGPRPDKSEVRRELLKMILENEEKRRSP
jgi:hypothetical protein